LSFDLELLQTIQTTLQFFGTETGMISKPKHQHPKRFGMVLDRSSGDARRRPLEFFSQVEYCDNLIFHRRAALDHLDQRLLDANRTIGQPSKITSIFGRKVTKYYKGKLQTVIEDLELPNPVIRTHYAHGSLKQYLRDHLCLRTEPAAN